MKHKINLTDGNDKNVAAKKLKTDPVDNTEPNEDKIKPNDDKKHQPFTSLEFKNLLKEPETRFQGLKRFSWACEHRKPNDKSAIDIVRAYISASPDCLEIFKCFGSHSSTDELATIFRCLLHILTRTASDLKDLYEKVGFNICGSLIQSHLQKVYHVLAFKQSPRTVALTLRMLTMMIMQNKDAASEVANNLDFSLRCFRDILDKLKGKLGYETRVAYIRFVLSFFMANDVNITQKILETQGLISRIFKGLKYDPASTIQLVFTTIKEKAIENMVVTKTAKIRFLAEPRVLVNISTLFKWDGVVDIVSDVEHDIKEYVRKLTYDFLYHACCPFKYGINFKDKMLGIGEKSKNHILLDFVTILLSSTSDNLVCDLIIEILKTCPDLLPRIMADYRLSLEPKSTDIWLRNCELTKKIYTTQSDVATALTQTIAVRSSVMRDSEKISIPDLIKMTIPGLFPPKFTIGVQKHCLKNSLIEIKTKCLELMLLMVEKAQTSLKFIANSENWEKTSYSSDEVELFTAQLQEAILKSYINVPLVVATWKESCCGNQSTIKGIVLKILCIIRDTFPQAITEAKFDITKLLFGVETAKTSESMSEENILILRMLSNAPHEYKWFKVIEKNQSPFRCLLQIIYDCKTDNCATYVEVVLLLKKVLIVNNLLDENGALETEIWVQNLTSKFKTHNDVILLNYLHDICSLIVRRPVQYNSLLTSFEQGVEKNHSETQSLTKLDKKFWESIPDVEIEPCVEEEREQTKLNLFTPEKVSRKFSYAAENGTIRNDEYRISLITLAALDNLKSCGEHGSEEKAALDSYLNSVMTNLFHSAKSFEDAKSFAHIFKSITQDVPEFETSFSNLYNTSEFLSLWLGDENEYGNYKNKDENIVSFVQNWLWNICVKSKKSKRNCLFNEVKSCFSQMLEKGSSDDLTSSIDTDLIKSQVEQLLLYFDTLNKLEKKKSVMFAKASKEILCTVIFLLKEVQTHSKTNSIKSEDSSMETDEPMEETRQKSSMLWKLFLECPSMEILFFEDIHVFSSDHFNYKEIDLEVMIGGDVRLSQICSSVVCDVIDNFPQEFKCFYIYTSKISTLLVKLLKEISSIKSKKDTEYFLLEAFSKLSSYISTLKLSETFNEVSNLLENVNNKSNAKIFCSVLCDCLKQILSDGKNSSHFSRNSIEKLLVFLTSKYLKDKLMLVNLVTKLLENYPHFALFAKTELMDMCMKEVNCKTVSLMAILIQSNPKLFAHWCEDVSLAELDEETKLLLVPVISHVLSTFLTEAPKNEFSAKTCITMLESYKSLVFVSIEEFLQKFGDIVSNKTAKNFMEKIFMAAHVLGSGDYFSTLVQSVLDLKDVSNINLENIFYVIDILQKINITKVLSNQMRISVVHLCMTYICSQQKSKNNEKVDDKAYNLLLLGLQSLISNQKDLNVSGKLSEIWDKFLKHTLKRHFENPISMKCLLNLIPLVYDKEAVEKHESVMNITTIKYMLTNHSKFLNVLLNESADLISQNSDTEELKSVVTELLLELCLHCKVDDLSEKDLGFLFGAYGCTLSPSDQNILKIILLYEQKGVSLSDYKPFLWGETALSSYRARRNLGDTLWKKPSPSDVLNCLNSQIMEATFQRFPLRRRMLKITDNLRNAQNFENEPKPTISASENRIHDNPVETQKVYDPSFLLPALLNLLGPENLVDCKVFVHSGALSYLMCCLASHCAMVRAIAASCLSLYYQHAITAWFPEKNLTLYLIRCVRNGMELKIDNNNSTTIPRLSSVVANFLSTVVRLHETPENHMFSVLHRFILIKPQLDLKNVPEFYVLFFSAEMESKVERTWVLNLVMDGLRDMGDYHIIKKRNVFQLLMCLHDSPVSDNYVRRQIFQILEQACSIRSVASDLIKNNGLVTWLTPAAKLQASANNGVPNTYVCLGNPGKRQENTTHIVTVLKAIWKTLNVSDFVAEDTLTEVQENENASTITQNDDDDVDSKPTEEPEKQLDRHASLAPFRVVKQIINFSISLLSNMMHMVDQASNVSISNGMLPFVCDTLFVLESCLSNLHERRKRSLLKNKEQESSMEDFCDLQHRDVEIIFNIGKLFMNCNQNLGNLKISIPNIITFWTPQSSEIEDKSTMLWRDCVNWVLEETCIIFDEKNKCKGNFVKLFKWVERWTLNRKIDTKTLGLLHQCYNSICTSSDDSKQESLVMLNSILDRDSTSTNKKGDSCMDALHKMQDIRQKFYMKDDT